MSPVQQTMETVTVRKAESRGHTDLGWLKSRHTFSFGSYHDPACMGFGPLRVINDDRVEPAKGFGEHPHHDMEIISYVVQGALQHKDSMGNGSVIGPGDVQLMRAGTGVRHSEFNPSEREPVHFLQIWIIPERKGLTPGYEQKQFSRQSRHNTLRLLASRDAREGSLTLSQDVDLYAGVLDAGRAIRQPLAPNRRAWVQVVRGGVLLNGKELQIGDGASVEQAAALDLEAVSDAEVLLFVLT